MSRLDPGQCPICYAQPKQAHGETCANHPDKVKEYFMENKMIMIIEGEHGHEKEYDMSRIRLQLVGVPDMTLQEFVYSTLELGMVLNRMIGGPKEDKNGNGQA